ncbi:DUF1697 domain-containing protein [Jiangella asiatica]|uniref:DUF1697 domain-containing protein n=1 Tax=Jiangella asiatica TaxID=2530372 RepID=A0A4R5DLQ8_9ACTN|nr:DUF1697 domain-containing protein [Jiangella asiatica]TDE12984.1 DUF1697 domain-containing protein [Jiangella asiatica]
MTRYAALLRGINVGGHNTVRMADLRTLVEALGHTDVVTYINSGNVVFTDGTPGADRAALETAIEDRLEQELGRRIAVLVRSRDELAEAVAANPFPDAAPPRVLLAFLRSVPAPADLARAGEVESGDDEFRLLGSTLYLHCPDGMGRSKLAAALSKPTADGTSRNLATVRKLVELADRAG